MKMVQEITLPKTADFYTRNYAFDVTRVAGACKTYNDPGPPPTPLSLDLDPNMAAILATYGDTHQASVDAIAGAAIQFFRTSEGPTETLDHIELRFLLTYEFGRMLTTGGVSDGSRLGPASRQQSMRHGEAVKKTSEMFGYGLALHYVAAALGIPTDWFTFVLENGARADFWACKSLA